MHTENTVFIDGPIDRIYELAANIQDWPRILPHYRYVTVHEMAADGSRKVVTMGAVRDGFPTPGARFPVKWRSIQICEPEERSISFKHIAGVATGMWVVWAMEDDPSGRGVRVTVRHDLRYPFDCLNGWFANDVVGNGFVSAIAGRTLATLKGIVERENQ